MCDLKHLSEQSVTVCRVHPLYMFVLMIVVVVMVVVVVVVVMMVMMMVMMMMIIYLHYSICKALGMERTDKWYTYSQASM